MYFDTIIGNGRVVDGTGNPWFKADVAIREGRIAKIGNCSSDQADRVIDAAGHVVTPGFIDLHQHGEIHLIINPNAESLVRQGITTMVGGNCGWSAAPISSKNRHLVHSPWWPKEIKPEWETFKGFFKIYERQGVAINVANYVGHGWVRGAVMGWEARLATRDELEEMKAHVAEAMEDGAIGFSSGLTYPPGCWSDTNEVVELCKVAAKYGGIYSTHDRGGPEFKGKVEAVEIAERAGIPVQIAHLETHGAKEFGRTDEVLRIVDDARARGVDVTFDLCTTLYGGGWLAGSMIPAWAYEGGAPKMLERVSDPATREKMKNDLLSRNGPNFRDIIMLHSRAHPEFLGMNLAEIAEKWGKDPWDAAYDLFKDEGLDLVEIGAATRGHKEEELRAAFKHPACMPNTDSWFRAPYGWLGKMTPHPREYGGIVIVLRKWVRGVTRLDMPEEPGAKILTLEEAIRKMTSLPAQRLGLKDRGLLREGMRADVVVFDPDRVSDKAPYPGPANRKPHMYPEGIPCVLVNGTIVIDHGEHTGSLPGKVLRGPGYKAS
jgi:N-acyl-D-aspartate/D-glutamate deacylase